MNLTIIKMVDEVFGVVDNLFCNTRFAYSYISQRNVDNKIYLRHMFHTWISGDIK